MSANLSTKNLTKSFTLRTFVPSSKNNKLYSMLYFNNLLDKMKSDTIMIPRKTFDFSFDDMF